jgi:predicted RNase H-like HicB family nuclease
MEKVKAFIERGNDGSFSVYVDLENKTLNYGIFGEGDTVKEAVEDFMSAYETMKEFHKEQEKYFVEAEFEIRYDMASFLNYYSGKLSLVGLEKITGINQRQLSHYVNGTNRPSRQTIRKINNSLHGFANELSQVHFS